MSRLVIIYILQAYIFKWKTHFSNGVSGMDSTTLSMSCQHGCAGILKSLSITGSRYIKVYLKELGIQNPSDSICGTEDIMN